jgi:hypothetical protein
MSTWIDVTGQAQLRSFVDHEGNFWLEQNASKQTRWAKLARKGHEVAWEFAGRGGSYTGRMLIDGEIYTPIRSNEEVSRPERLINATSCPTARQPKDEVGVPFRAGATRVDRRSTQLLRSMKGSSRD